MNLVAALFAVLSFTIHLLPVAGNFHVSVSTSSFGSSVIACPSRNMNCDCFMNKRGAGRGFARNIMDVANIPKFTIEPGFCGQQRAIDFYRRSDGHYDYYLNGLDGKLQGSCTVNGPNIQNKQVCVDKGTAANIIVDDRLVCLGDICGPDQ